MDWIYEQAVGSTSAVVPLRGFAERHGIDAAGAVALLRSCRYEGLLSGGAPGDEDPRAQLTTHGVAEVLARRRRRTDPVELARACRTAVLQWFYRQRIAKVYMPVTEEFVRDAGAVWAGTRFSESDAREAAQYLCDKGLIKGVKVAEFRGPVRAEITTEGIDCVTDWEGDVAGYLRDQRGAGSTVNHGPVFHGNTQGGQWAWGNRDVTQTYTAHEIAPGFEPLAEAVAAILKRLPALDLDPDDRQDAEDAANEVLAEVSQSEPEPRRVRRAVAALRGFLMPIATNAARSEVQQLAQQGIDQLNAAIGM
jgi:hypothetical protein